MTIKAKGNQVGVEGGLSNNLSHWAELQQNQLELLPKCSQEATIAHENKITHFARNEVQLLQGPN